MRKRNYVCRESVIVFLVVVVMMLAAACGPASGPQDPTLKMGALPILDTIPLYVAEEKGYFAEQGITVEILHANSALERDTMMQAGQIDGMVTDMVAVALFNADSPQVTIVASARRATPGSPQFRVLAAPGSGIETAADLSGVPIGISENSVIEYITWRMLAAEGLGADEIQTESIPAIPVRFEALMNGQVKAATLPDPLAQAAVAAGAVPIVDDGSYVEYSQSVLAFSAESLKAKPDTVEKFMAAWNRAVAEINANPAEYGELLVEKGRVPESIRGQYAMPELPEKSIPTVAEWDDVVAWLKDKGLLEKDLPYAGSVSGDYQK